MQKTQPRWEFIGNFEALRLKSQAHDKLQLTDMLELLTPGTRERTIDFESTAFDHSAISPRQWDFIKVVPEPGRS